MTAEADCTQLANLVRITHKYQFRNIMTWALSALYHYYSRPGAFDDILTTLPSSNAPTPLTTTHHPPMVTAGGLPAASSSHPPTLMQLTELAALCERADLLECTLVRWKRIENTYLVLRFVRPSLFGVGELFLFCGACARQEDLELL